MPIAARTSRVRGYMSLRADPACCSPIRPGIFRGRNRHAQISKKSSAYILTHFSTWLSMNYFILVERWISRLCGATDWRLTILPLTAAIAIIPLTASVALKFTGSSRTALIAAGLAAFNPYLVMWGPVIRSYSLLVAFSLLAINEFFTWYSRRDWWSGVPMCWGCVTAANCTPQRRLHRRLSHTIAR